METTNNQSDADKKRRDTNSGKNIISVSSYQTDPNFLLRP